MNLRHFTSANALAPIGSHGLTIGDVVTSLRQKKGEVAVWLTTADTPEGLGLAGAAVDKQRVRLTVDVPANRLLHRWDDWKIKNVDPRTIATMERVAGPGADPATWYIYFGWLKADLVLEAIDMATGRPIVDWRRGLPGGEPVPAVPYGERLRWHRAMLRTTRARFPAR